VPYREVEDEEVERGAGGEVSKVDRQMQQ